MERIRTYALNLKSVTEAGLALFILLGVFGLQALGLPQPITGPLVNAALLATALTLGPWYAGGIGTLTPVIGFARGILAAPLAPTIPFIAVGNGVMIMLFHFFFRRQRPMTAVIVSSTAKAALLTVAVRELVTVPSPVVVMMQWPQLLTAVAGGILVWAMVAMLRNGTFTE